MSGRGRLSIAPTWTATPQEADAQPGGTKGWRLGTARQLAHGYRRPLLHIAGNPRCAGLLSLWPDTELGHACLPLHDWAELSAARPLGVVGGRLVPAPGRPVWQPSVGAG